LSAIANTWSKLSTFFTETRSELKKVTFPSRNEVISTTIVVVIASFAFAFFLWVSDMVIQKLYEGVLRVIGV